MGQVIGFLKLSWQAFFAPTPEWEAAARHALLVERQRVHAASDAEDEQ